MKKFSESKINKQKIVSIKEDLEIKNNIQNVSDNDLINKDDVKSSDPSPIKFFSKLFESRQMAHVFHLQVKSNSGSGWEHDALNKFYNDILEMTDNLIETYQGQYGIIDGYDIIDSSETNQISSLEYFKKTIEYIKENRKVFNIEDTHIQSSIDEIVSLFYKSIYRLTNLK